MVRVKHTPQKHSSTVQKDGKAASDPATGGGDVAKPVVSQKLRQVKKLDRKPHRYRPGTVALREIRRYQKGTELLLPKAPCSRWIREIAQNISGADSMRFNADAIEALRTAAEDLMVSLFRKAQLRACDRKKITVTALDLRREFQNFQDLAVVAQQSPSV